MKPISLGFLYLLSDPQRPQQDSQAQHELQNKKKLLGVYRRISTCKYGYGYKPRNQTYLFLAIYWMCRSDPGLCLRDISDTAPLYLLNL